MIIHYDLFAGIGGFSLALDNIYGRNNTKHIFVERDEFCQLVLKKHWPEAEYHSCIYGFIANSKCSGQSGSSELDRSIHSTPNSIGEASGIDDLHHKTILTGGFPCQPFSTAGRRKGTEDDRYLWPAMFESIKLIRPDWIIAENVAGLVSWSEGLVLEQVCSDLESEGYEVQPFIIPACAVNAPHRRERVWIVANCKSGGSWRGKSERDRIGKSEEKVRDGNRNVITNARHFGQEEQQEQTIRNQQYSWDENWIEVATRLCRVDDGISRRMDRSPRLKALGNAIVPQVAEEIFKAILYKC